MALQSAPAADVDPTTRRPDDFRHNRAVTRRAQDSGRLPDGASTTSPTVPARGLTGLLLSGIATVVLVAAASGLRLHVRYAAEAASSASPDSPVPDPA